MLTRKGLDRAAEQTLARAARAGDREALQALVARHESLVSITAKRYVRLGVSNEDLLSEGRLGLIHAAQRFDPDRGTRFTTYARWWVRAYMRAYASNNRRIVSPPNTRALRALSTSLPRARREQEQRQQGPVTRGQLAEVLGVDEEDVAVAQGLLDRHDVPVQPTAAPSGGLAPMAREPSPTEDTEGDATPGNVSPEEAVAWAEERRIARESIVRGLDVLDARERYIVEQRYLNGEQRTLQDLARELGISRERVRQVEGRALRKMRGVAGGKDSEEGAAAA